MKTKLPFKPLLTILLFHFSIPQVSAQCTATSVYTFTFHSKKYELIKEKKTWEEAARCAVERGGYLVQIDSLSEQTAVYNSIVASGVPSNYNPVNDAGGISYIWIGTTDKTTEGAWLWDGDNNGIGINFWNGQGANGTNNGTAVAGRFINWGGKSTGTIKEPDDFNSNQDAAGIALSVTPSGTIPGEWNDIAITNTLYYIVEYDGTVNIKELKDPKFITVFPNSGTSQLIIATRELLTNASLRLFSITGQLIFEKTNLSGNTFDANISALTNGIYFLEINQNGISYRTKFAKN